MAGRSQKQLEHFPNLVSMFLTRAREKGEAPFLSARRDGTWETTSYADAARRVAALADSLKRIGLQPGDRVMLVSENRPEWLIADLAIMAAGCVTVPTYTTNTTRDHQHILNNSGAAAVIVSTQKLARALMPAVLFASDCRHIVSIDDISRIEVIRGPVSSQYGTNAFFMTINIVTRGAAEGARVWGRIGIHSINGEVATAGFAQGSIDKQVRGSVMVMNRLGESIVVEEVNGSTPLTADGANTFIAAVAGTYGGSFGQVRATRSRRDSLYAPYDADPTLDPGYALFNYQLIAEGGHTRELTKKLTGSVRGYTSLYRFYDEIDDGSNDLFLDYGDATTVGAELRGR
jgi:hypothetical protein